MTTSVSPILPAFDSTMMPEGTALDGTSNSISNTTTTKSKITESKSLESEAKDLLNRIGVSGVARRCAEYRPTLDELKSTTFSDYIRGEILGVPLPGYEFLYIYEDKEGRETKREVPMGQVTTLIAAKRNTLSPEGSGLEPPKREDISTRTRSRTKAVETTKESTLKNVVPPKSYMHRPKKYQMCWYKLRDGIAKVSLPSGLWARVDTTARGRHWVKGSKFGDIVIPSPIKQALSGIGGVYEYAHIEQPPITIAQFRTQADEYRKRHVGKEFDDDHSDKFCDALARKFWKRLGPTMEPATYGADMEGTLFKNAHAYGWNVDRLESCLCLLRADAKEGDSDDRVFHLPGVTNAYLYFGMWASAFAVHTEDMNLLSINYLHAGSPKYWYAIAHEDSKRFESLARSHFSGQASECHEFLRHKRCLLSPAILKKAGIKFTTCVQRPGDAIITFPGSYHFGFNTGFNIAESTNFAVPEWIPYGEAAKICMCHPHSVRIQMKRVKSLLENYEKDMCYRKSIGLSHVTYSNWAKQEAKKDKKEKVDESEKRMSIEKAHDLMQLTTINACAAVEIKYESKPVWIKNKKRMRKYNEWRMAKRVRPGLFVPRTQVICIVIHDGARHSTSNCEHEFCVGTIVKLVDGHVKIHLMGRGKKDDIWFEQDSDHIFLDCGLTHPPVSVCDDDMNILKMANSTTHRQKKLCK